MGVDTVVREVQPVERPVDVFETLPAEKWPFKDGEGWRFCYLLDESCTQPVHVVRRRGANIIKAPFLLLRQNDGLAFMLPDEGGGTCSTARAWGWWGGRRWSGRWGGRRLAWGRRRRHGNRTGGA